MGRVTPVLLSGGSGVRLWPMSREQFPKQLLSLCSERSMLQDTATRVVDQAHFNAPLVICNNEHRFIIAEQLRQSGVKPTAILLEPEGRDTAAAAAIAALQARRADADAVILLLPADHRVSDAEGFRAAVLRALPAAEAGNLVTFGIEPTRPETGYGYIRQGGALTVGEGLHRVAAFVEKPDLVRAEAMLAEGGYAWNSGMFLFRADAFLAELAVHAPDVLAGAEAAIEAARDDLDFVRLDAAAFATAPKISIDRAVMEKTGRAAVLPISIGWADVGSWAALWDIGDKDEDGNVIIGDAILQDAGSCYVRSEEGQLTAVVGLRDVVVVTTADAVLVAHRDQAQNVKQLVERLRREGRSEPVIHRLVHRPWGSYQSVHDGERFQVKQLTVNPGCRLSLQKHYHRAEHWVVVGGTALVTRGEEQLYIYENQSIYLPIGTVHRLENPGKLPLDIIEVQSGSYLGEDDIVRLEDNYGRN